MYKYQQGAGFSQKQGFKMTKKAKKMYSEWFKENWIKTGGLITPATASKILEVSSARIAQMINEQKIKKYEYYEDGKTLLSFTEVYNVKQEKEEKKK